eukprot:g13917.t1
MAARPGVGTATAAPLTGWKKKAAECSEKGAKIKKPEEPACTKNGCGRKGYEDWEKLGVDETCARDCKKHGWKEGDDLVCVKEKEMTSNMPSDYKMPELTDVDASSLTEFNNPKIGVDKVCEATCGAKQGSEYASITSNAKKWKKGDGVVCLDPPKRSKADKKLCEEMNKKLKKQLEKQGRNSHKHKKAGPSEDDEGAEEGADVDENNQQVDKGNGGKKGGLSGVLIVVIIVGSVLLLCGCGLLLRGSGAGSPGSGAGTLKIRKAGGRR